jgi:hypothetical protein
MNDSNNPLFQWNLDNQFQLWSGQVIQGNDLVVTIKGLPADADTKVWSWVHKIFTQADPYGGAVIQQNSGTGTISEVSFTLDTDTNTQTATITNSLPLSEANYSVGTQFSFSFGITGYTQNVQVVFLVSSINTFGTSSNPIQNSFVDLTEMTTTDSPITDTARIYAKDDAGVTRLFYKDSSGTENEISTYDIAGNNLQLQYNYNGTLGADAGLVFNPTTTSLKVGSDLVDIASVVVGNASGSNRDITFSSDTADATKDRWTIRTNSNLETGGNIGSDFAVIRRDDAGNFLSNALYSKRSTGYVGINTDLPSEQLDVAGVVKANGFKVGNMAGVSGTFTTNDGKSITVTDGIVTSITI